MGNQMFQYACAYALAKRMSAELYLDCAVFARDPLRSFSLHVFPLAGRENPQVSRPCNIVGKAVWKIRAKLPFLPFQAFIIVEEKSLNFNPRVLRLKKNVYLKGHWQSEKYFVDAADAVKALYNLEPFIPDEPRRRYPEIFTGTSVSVHLRRGDYLNAHVRSIHGLCEIANSSFSWWAAWLGERQGANVIAPARWFNAPSLQEQAGDIIPERWIAL